MSKYQFHHHTWPNFDLSNCLKFENEYLHVYHAYIKLLFAGSFFRDSLEHFIWRVAHFHRYISQKYYNTFPKLPNQSLCNKKNSFYQIP